MNPSDQAKLTAILRAVDRELPRMAPDLRRILAHLQPGTTPAAPPTRRQFQVAQAIQELTRRHGYPPSLDEIGEELGGLSKACVHEHVHCLMSKRLLHHSSRGYRSWILTPAMEALIDSQTSQGGDDAPDTEHPTPNT